MWCFGGSILDIKDLVVVFECVLMMLGDVFVLMKDF